MKRYENAAFLTMDQEGSIYENGAMVVVEDHIVAIGDRKDIGKAFPEAEPVDLRGRLVLPGLVNSHFHLAQSLFRGVTDDMKLEPWLLGCIWPLQAAHDPETFLAGARLAMLEMARSGTTTFVESMVIHYGLEELMDEVQKSGLRARLAKVVMDPVPGSALPQALTENFDEALEEALQAQKKVTDPGRLDIWLGPRWTGMYNPELIDKVNSAMDTYGFVSTMHYAESPEDVNSIYNDSGVGPGEFLRTSGMLYRPYQLIHCPWLKAGDIDILAQGKVSVSHCPVSAMKGAMGYADIPRMLESGVAVGIGTDAPACNNSSDMFAEMKTAALLHKHQTGEPVKMPAHKVLEMGTIEGAESIQAASYLGSLEVGKKADFITLDTSLAAPMPEKNYYSSLVYSLCGRDVRDVYVGGVPLLLEGQSTVYDEEKVRADARVALEKLIKRAGI